MSGLYADIDGPAGVEAIKMADRRLRRQGAAARPIEVLIADHQNKADVAATKAREWFDTQGLDMLIGGTNSGTALAMAKVAAEKKKPVHRHRRRLSSALTNEQCTPYTVHYAYDTVALAKGTGSAVVKAGGKSWYFLTADYAFGHVAGERHRRPSSRPPAARWSARCAHPLNAIRLLVLPAAGAGVQGADPRPGQRRRRHHQLDQGGQRIRHHQDHEAGRPAGVHQRHPLAWA